MKRENIILVLIIGILVLGCSNDGLILNIKFYEVDGLEKNGEVLMNGYKVGEVKDIQWKNDSFLVKIKLEESKIPNNSEFRITNKDLLGTKAIEFIYGNSKDYLENNSIINGSISLQQPVSIESAGTILNRFLNPCEKEDSILFELRKLNRNIELLLEKNGNQ